MSMTRYAQVIGIRPERLEVYKQLHMAVWPAVLAKIHECNMRNYSIFLLDDHTLYAYFEYVGDDFDGDMAKMAADPMTQEWWAICSPMQTPVAEAAPGERWHNIVEVFHLA
jgi:L-rhamnose mutarotase